MTNIFLPIGVNELAKKKSCRYGSHKKVIILNVRNVIHTKTEIFTFRHSVSI